MKGGGVMEKVGKIKKEWLEKKGKIKEGKKKVKEVMEGEMKEEEVLRIED